MREQRGFTLAEIAIVMVIIGLLLGGIMRGQEMVTQARIKNVVSDFSGLSAAFQGYFDRYRKIPGDDPCAGAGPALTVGNCGTATPRWTGTPPAVGGNGDGIVSGAYNSATPTNESRLWWDHLRRAGFVTGIGDQQPFNALTGMIGVQTGDAAGGAALGSDAAGTGGLIGLIICSANLPDKVAIATDEQLDDGVPAAGTVRAQLQAAPNPSVAKQATVAYAESGTNVYTVCRPL